MNIEVLSAYSGVLTHGRIVFPGVYAEDDPRIAEAVEVMIRKGFAEQTFKPLPEPVEVTPAPLPTSEPDDDDDVIGAEVREVSVVRVVEDDLPDYDDMTVDDLAELAESFGLEVVGTGRSGKVLKADLIRALEQHNA